MRKLIFLKILYIKLVILVILCWVKYINVGFLSGWDSVVYCGMGYWGFCLIRVIWDCDVIMLIVFKLEFRENRKVNVWLMEENIRWILMNVYGF